MKYSVRTNILLYLGLLAAIPVQWKQIIYDRCDHVNINQDVIEKSYISISNIDLCYLQQFQCNGNRSYMIDVIMLILTKM